MKSALLALLLFFSLTASTADIGNLGHRYIDDVYGDMIVTASQPITSLDEAKAKYQAWNLLCLELRDIDCTGIKPPKVKTFPRMTDRPGLAGYYDGTDTVYIRKDLRGAMRLEVLAHEMSHYLDEIYGLLPEMPVYEEEREAVLLLCMSEKRAWAVSDAFHSKYGDKRDVVGERWVDWYAHCQPYRDILYPDGT